MTAVMVDPYSVELRVYHPERNEVAFVKATGHNRGQCVNRTANRYPGWVVTLAEEPVFAGEAETHKWCAYGTVCVNCGVHEHLAVDDACSGIYGLL